ncbi:MAG: hypothetical protein ACLU0O_08690 [Collinsella sp.]
MLEIAGVPHSGAAEHTYGVVGSLCENNDKLAIDRRPPEVRRATCSSSTMRARTGSRCITTTTAGSSVPR